MFAVHVHVYIHKTYILGTYRINRIKQYRLGRELNHRCLGYKTNTQTTVTNATMHMFNFKACCEGYHNLYNFKSLYLSDAYRNTDHPLPGSTVLIHVKLHDISENVYVCTVCIP